MIDVYNIIRPYLIFQDPDDFYYLQILQRKKENPAIGSNSRVIKNYYISSLGYLEDKYEEIRGLCEYFNARAMLRLNKRSYRKVAFKTIQNVANCMGNEEYLSISKSYDRACGDGHNDKNKSWIVDIDGKVENFILDKIIDKIQISPPYNTYLFSLPTKNGVHIITRPFDLREFRIEYPLIDIHKDNPINLYIPANIYSL